MPSFRWKPGMGCDKDTHKGLLPIRSVGGNRGPFPGRDGGQALGAALCLRAAAESPCHSCSPGSLGLAFGCTTPYLSSRKFRRTDFCHASRLLNQARVGPVVGHFNPPVAPLSNLSSSATVQSVLSSSMLRWSPCSAFSPTGGLPPTMILKETVLVISKFLPLWLPTDRSGIRDSSSLARTCGPSSCPNTSRPVCLSRCGLSTLYLCG